jgi:hypothetical protein
LDGVDGEKYAGHSRQKQQLSHGAAYFNCDEIEEKVVLSFVPRPFTTLMIATAVAPDSSAKNWRHFAIMAGSVEPPRKI